MLRISVLYAALVFTVAGCGAAQVEVFHDYDPAFDFGTLHTFAWVKRNTAQADAVQSNDLLRVRVQRAVDAELVGKGMRLASSVEEADALLLWYAALETKLDLRQLDYTFTGTLPDRYTDTFEQGTLVIDIVSRTERRLVWRGRAEARVDEHSSPEERAERIQAAVAKMFKKYPPR